MERISSYAYETLDKYLSTQKKITNETQTKCLGLLAANLVQASGETPKLCGLAPLAYSTRERFSL